MGNQNQVNQEKQKNTSVQEAKLVNPGFNLKTSTAKSSSSGVDNSALVKVFLSKDGHDGITAHEACELLYGDGAKINEQGLSNKARTNDRGGKLTRTRIRNVWESLSIDGKRSAVAIGKQGKRYFSVLNSDVAALNKAANEIGKSFEINIDNR